VVDDVPNVEVLFRQQYRMIALFSLHLRRSSDSHEADLAEATSPRPLSGEERKTNAQGELFRFDPTET